MNWFETNPWLLVVVILVVTEGWLQVRARIADFILKQRNRARADR